MKTSLLLLILVSNISLGQMNSQDSIQNSQALWWDFDCYEQNNSRTVFMNYSNGQESCIIYNLEKKDSIVKYYYSGQISSIGIYFGCVQDTLWSTIYEEYNLGDEIHSRQLKVGEKYNRAESFVTIDSVEYQFYTGYQLSYSPVYEMTLFNEDGKLIEHKWKNKSAYIDFTKLARDKYLKPE